MGKFEYDESKDELLDHREIQLPGAKSVLIASLNSYDGGDPKIQIQRTIKKQDGTVMYIKTGRLLYDEFAEIAKAVKEMYAKLK